MLFSPMMVYDEWTAGSDDLANWVKDRRNNGLCVEPTESVQSKFRVIADYVNRTYEQPQAQRFLEGADPWVIAQAKEDDATVVTHEKFVGPDSSRVKIPNICRQFNVDWCDLYSMLRALRARF